MTYVYWYIYNVEKDMYRHFDGHYITREEYHKLPDNEK